MSIIRKFFKKRPIRKFLKKTYRKFMGYRKRTNRMVNRNAIRGPIAQRQIAQLKYVDSFSSLLVAATVSETQWNLNSIFDPNRSGGGHQPLYRDQYSSLYAQFRVYRCDYKIRASCNGTVGGTLCVLPNNSSVVLTNIDQACETPGAQLRQFGSVSGDSSVITMSGSVYLPKLNGKSATAYKTDDRTAGSTTADPSEVLSLHVLSISSGTPTIDFVVELNYHVEFFDPFQIAAS